MRFYYKVIKSLLSFEKSEDVTYYTATSMPQSFRLVPLYMHLLAIVLIVTPISLVSLAAVSFLSVRNNIEQAETIRKLETKLSVLRTKNRQLILLGNKQVSQKSPKIKAKTGKKFKKLKKTHQKQQKKITQKAEIAVRGIAKFRFQDEVKLNESLTSPFPVEINHTDMTQLADGKIKLTYKLKNLINGSISGGVSGYMTYVNTKNEFKRIYYPKQAKLVKGSDYITGPSRKFKMRHAYTGRMYFDIANDEVAKIVNVHVSLKSDICFKNDVKFEKCATPTARKSYTARLNTKRMGTINPAHLVRNTP